MSFYNTRMGCDGTVHYGYMTPLVRDRLFFSPSVVVLTMTVREIMRSRLPRNQIISIVPSIRASLCNQDCGDLAVGLIGRVLIGLALVGGTTAVASGGFELARDGQSLAVIVSPHPVSTAPPGASSIADLTLSSPKAGILLHENFEGTAGTSIDTLGWKTTKGTNVIGHGGTVHALPGRENEFAATSEKVLAVGHTVTEEDPLSVAFVVKPPVARQEEAWMYVRVHTDEGKRWTHGVGIRPNGKLIFAVAAEPNDPDRVEVPAEAGRALDLKMLLGPKHVRWLWRTHGKDEDWQPITSWGGDGEVTISGVLISSNNHISNTGESLATRRIITATRDLRRVLDEATGASFKVVAEPPEDRAVKQILVGNTPAIRQLVPDIDWGSVEPDDVIIRTAGDNLILSGGEPRGIVYAIYTFLQDVVGCRWWTAGAEQIPRVPDLAVPTLDMRYHPRFEFRVVTGLQAASFEARAWHRLSFDLTFDTGTHSITKQLPKKLFLEHPEWFMYCLDDGFPNKKYNFQATLRGFERTIRTETERNDLDFFREVIKIAKRTQRIPQQPCLNSEGARRTITRNALAELDAKPDAWRTRPSVLWVTQNDGRYLCRCEKCAAVQSEEGSDSANWVRLVNGIAAEVEKRNPNVLVGMFAYLHTEAPPRKIKPRKNVLVYTALLQNNKRDSVSHYQSHADNIRKWSAISNHFWVWDYDTNFRNYFQPHPNYYVNGESLKFFRDVGLDGVMVQSSRGVAADLAAMRTWVTAQMMWNPDRDPRELMVEFTNGYYGAAGPWIVRYIDLLHEVVHRKADYWLGCYRDDTTGWLELEDIHAAIDLLNEAAHVVKDHPVLANRVWMARRAIDFAWLDRYDELTNTACEQGIDLGLPDPATVVDSLSPHRNHWGNFREGPRPADFYAYFDKLRERFPAKQQP